MEYRRNIHLDRPGGMREAIRRPSVGRRAKFGLECLLQLSCHISSDVGFQKSKVEEKISKPWNDSLARRPEMGGGSLRAFRQADPKRQRNIDPKSFANFDEKLNNLPGI